MFNIRLNETRKMRGYTAQQVTDMLVVSLSTYRKYESGHRSPNLETLVKIANILEVSTDYLLCRDSALEEG